MKPNGDCHVAPNRLCLDFRDDAADLHINLPITTKEREALLCRPMSQAYDRR
jgi:hypothetical protein